jgi:hypothetical protein
VVVPPHPTPRVLQPRTDERPPGVVPAPKERRHRPVWKRFRVGFWQIEHGACQRRPGEPVRLDERDCELQQPRAAFVFVLCVSVLERGRRDSPCGGHESKARYAEKGTRTRDHLNLDNHVRLGYSFLSRPYDLAHNHIAHRRLGRRPHRTRDPTRATRQEQMERRRRGGI